MGGSNVGNLDFVIISYYNIFVVSYQHNMFELTVTGLKSTIIKQSKTYKDFMNCTNKNSLTIT